MLFSVEVEVEKDGCVVDLRVVETAGGALSNDSGGSGADASCLSASRNTQFLDFLVFS